MPNLRKPQTALIASDKATWLEVRHNPEFGIAAEVMGRQSWNLTDLCFLFNHAPDDLGTEAATPDSASFVD